MVGLSKRDGVAPIIVLSFILLFFFVGVQGQTNSTNITATCLSGSQPFVIAETCAYGFYCPFLPSPPTFCSPLQNCSVDRLAGIFCDAQGSTEPIVCTKGYYCPTPKEMYICPKGYFCRTGTVVPEKCPSLSICGEGSHRIVYVGSLIACIILDAFVIGLWIFFRKIYNRASGSKFIPLRVKPASEPAASSSVTSAPPIDIPSPSLPSFAAMEINPEEPTLSNKVVSEGLVRGFEKARNGRDLPMQFEFSNLSVALPTGKHLLQSVSGTIKPGRLTAILGPSGAGKTTFMNCLMGKIKRTGGSLRIDDTEMEMHKLKQVIGYVPQEDIMIPELTVRENIHHSASIRLPSSWTRKEVADFTEAVIEALDLSHVADTVVGDAMKRGVSGGQKKRTNIGMELAGAPLSIFLDEPTSGLDATAALKVAHILRDIRELGLTIVAVIHQPRQEIFDTFDDLLMIAPGGNTAFLGPRALVVDFFKQQGFVFDLYKNQADELMDILSGKGTKSDQSAYAVSELVEYWESHKHEVRRDDDGKEERKYGKEVMDGIVDLAKERGGNFFSQAFLCHNRSMVQQYRLVGALILEIGVALLAGGVMGAAASGGNERFRGILISPFTLISPAPFVFFVPMIGMLMGMAVGLAGSPAGVKTFGEERLVYYREAAAGHNRVAYYFGKMVSMFYRETLAALHFAMIYHILSQPMIKFDHLFAIIFLYFFAVYGLAAVVSFLVKRENASLLAVVICLFAGVFNGFGPSLKTARSWGMIWFWDISYGRWLSEAMFSDEVYPFNNVYDVKVAADAFGFSLDNYALNCGLAFVIAIVLHLVGLVAMLLMNRQKQR